MTKVNFVFKRHVSRLMPLNRSLTVRAVVIVRRVTGQVDRPVRPNLLRHRVLGRVVILIASPTILDLRRKMVRNLLRRQGYL